MGSEGKLERKFRADSNPKQCALKEIDLSKIILVAIFSLFVLSGCTSRRDAAVQLAAEQILAEIEKGGYFEKRFGPLPPVAQSIVIVRLPGAPHRFESSSESFEWFARKFQSNLTQSVEAISYSHIDGRRVYEKRIFHPCADHCSSSLPILVDHQEYFESIGRELSSDLEIFSVHSSTFHSYATMRVNDRIELVSLEAILARPAHNWVDVAIGFLEQKLPPHYHRFAVVHKQIAPINYLQEQRSNVSLQ